MKIHIFIATTQGLVAIQNITPIDDEDISSVVSVNGTSTTANISGSYHNFVKKGVGIIHQMFGACSYRVDISARIDQGNSWQVAMIRPCWYDGGIMCWFLVARCVIVLVIGEMTYRISSVDQISRVSG